VSAAPAALRPLVMKFGGTSVADAACQRRVAALVKDALAQAPLVVLSATSKTTDALFAAARAAAGGDFDRAQEAFDGLWNRHLGIAAELLLGDAADDLAARLDGQRNYQAAVSRRPEKSHRPRVGEKRRRRDAPPGELHRLGRDPPIRGDRRADAEGNTIRRVDGDEGRESDQRFNGPDHWCSASCRPWPGSPWR